MHGKSIIIIGGGLSGLSCGCYGQMNGYHTSIFEMHDRVGGVCTGWKRKGYTIDGAMNWLIGTKPGTEYYRVWEELGATQDWEVFNHTNYITLEDEDGLHSFPCDIDELEAKMLSISPEDREDILTFTDAVRKCSHFDMPIGKPQSLYTFFDYLRMVRMLPFFRFIRKWGKQTAGTYAKRYASPLLRTLLSMGNDESLIGMPAFSLPMLFSWLNNGEAGYVIGGAQALVGSIGKRYQELGGELHLKTRVEKILIEDDRAVGIRLTDGTEYRADHVVSAADGHATIFDMLDAQYVDDTIKGYYRDLRVYPPLIYIGLGVDMTFDEIPESLNGILLSLDEPVVIAEKERRALNMLIYRFDPTLSPEGKTTVVVMLDTDYDYWAERYEDKKSYRAEKQYIAELVIKQLEKHFPGITPKIEMTDVATPMTWVRYTGNWRGSYEGWLLTADSFMMEMKKTLPGLDNFYMAGQWVNPGGGMPTAAISGNHTIQMICHEDRKSFITSLPG